MPADGTSAATGGNGDFGRSPIFGRPGDYGFNEWEKIRLPHTQKLNWITPKIQKGPVRGFTCLITNDATPKQIAAVKLIDSKGSHVTT